MNHCINHPDRPVKTRGLCVACESKARRRGVIKRLPLKRPKGAARLCVDCGQSVSRGRTGTQAVGCQRCLVCETRRVFRGWRFIDGKYRRLP